MVPHRIYVTRSTFDKLYRMNGEYAFYGKSIYKIELINKRYVVLEFTNDKDVPKLPS